MKYNDLEEGFIAQIAFLNIGQGFIIEKTPTTVKAFMVEKLL